MMSLFLFLLSLIIISSEYSLILIIALSPFLFTLIGIITAAVLNITGLAYFSSGIIFAYMIVISPMPIIYNDGDIKINIMLTVALFLAGLVGAANEFGKAKTYFRKRKKYLLRNENLNKKK